MPLTVVTGGPNTGKTGRVYDALRKAARSGLRGVLLLPSEPDAARARAELARTEPLGVRVAQVDRFLESEWALRGDGRRFIGGPSRDILLSRALASAQVAAQPGRGAVSLLGVVAAEAGMRCAPRGASSRGVADRLLAALDAYRGELDRLGLVEPGEAARLLARQAPAVDIIVAHRFMDLSTAQEALLTGWGAGQTRVFATLPWSKGSPATESLRPLVERLVGAGAALEEARGPGADDPPELARIATDLFADPRPRPGTGHVSFGIAQGDEAEARLITGYAAAWMADGVPPERIAVAFRDPVRHVGWLRRIFDEAGIAADFDVRVPVGETPMGRALLHLWAFASGGMGREHLSAFLRTPFAGVDAAVADLADARWRSSRLSQGEALLRAAGPAERIARGAVSLAAGRVDAEAGNKWKALADTMLSNAHPGDAPVTASDGALDAAVHRALVNTIADVLDLGEGVVTSAEMWTAFAAAAVSPLVSERLGRVQVTSIERLRSRRFDGVVLGGLTASEFPRLGGEDRLQGDAVRRVLGALGIDPAVRSDASAERMSFYLGVTRARQMLALVRRESDDEGRALRESVFWDEFLDLYRDPEESGRGELPEPVTLSFGDVESGTAGVARSHRGRLSDPRAIDALRSRGPLSAGELEVYSGCPYRWFVERVLRPRVPDRLLDAAAAGSAAHAALAAFYRRWQAETGERRVTAGRMAEALSMAREESAAVLAQAPTPADLDEQQLMASVAPQVASLVERDATFLPDYEPLNVEWSFGSGDDGEPVEIGGVAVVGRVDRIDVGPQGLVIVDYKRSRASSLVQLRDKGLLQLQIYASAASQRFGLPVAGGVYRSLASGDDRGFVLSSVHGAFKPKDVIDESELTELLAEAGERVRAAADGIHAGRVEPAPDADRCRTCSARQFCDAAPV